MASGIARGRIHTTTVELCKMAPILKVIKIQSKCSHVLRNPGVSLIKL